MSGRKGMHGTFLSDQSTRQAFLRYIREGYGRGEASELIGLVYTTVWRYIKLNPEFLEELRDAEQVSVERAIRVLVDIMEGSDDEKNRIAAADKVIKYRTRDQKRDVQVTHTVVALTGDQSLQLLDLTRRLEQRAIDTNSKELNT